MSETDSELDEPPTKISKTEAQTKGEMVEEHLEQEEEDEMGEGQEEWLSDGILTDDDTQNFNTDPKQESLSKTAASPDSQTPADDKTPSLEESAEQTLVTKDENAVPNVDNTVDTEVLKDTAIEVSGEIKNETEPDKTSEPKQQEDIDNKTDMIDIEEALNSFEVRNEMKDEVESFIIRKPDTNNEEVNKESSSIKQTNDDGNDTDELLRMLGDDDSKVKKKVLVKKSNKKEVKEQDSTDDEIEQTSSVKGLKVPNNVQRKNNGASKAVSEDMSDDGDSTASSDEAITVKKMFGVTKNKADSPKNTVDTSIDSGKVIVKQVHKNKPTNSISRMVHSTPKTNVNKAKVQNKTHQAAVASKAVIKMYGKQTNYKTDVGTRTTTNNATKTKSFIDKKHKQVIVKTITKNSDSVKSESLRAMAKMPTVHKSDVDGNGDPDIEEECEEEFLDDEEHLDQYEEELGNEESETEEDTRCERVMKPERMEDDMPSDGESHSEDSSLYDEIPSSDSEDLDDWFTLDIRAETAGDYLPLLGPRARELLMEEKKRVSTRLESLRQSMSTLTESARKQAEQLRHATMTLAELDDMLKTT